MIPRNLNEPDVIIHKPFALNWKQIGYLTVGIGGMILILKTDWSISTKTILTAGSCGLGALGALFRYEGYTLDELAINGLHYLQRRLYYKGLTGKGVIQVAVDDRKKKAEIKPLTKRLRRSVGFPAQTTEAPKGAKGLVS